MTFTNRSNTNEKRQAVEAALKAGGLVQVAGGNRNSYYGRPGQGVDGYMVRVGIRTFRVVKRTRLSNGLHDLTLGKEHYHGQTNAAEVQAWVGRLLATEWGTKPAVATVAL